MLGFLCCSIATKHNFCWSIDRTIVCWSKSFAVELYLSSMDNIEPPIFDIWPILQSNNSFAKLYESCAPSRYDKVKTKVDLDDLSLLLVVLARIIIVTSQARKWKKQEWTMDTGFDGIERSVMPQNPMVTHLRSDERSPPERIFFG